MKLKPKTLNALETIGRYAIILLCAWIAAFCLTHKDEIEDRMGVNAEPTQSIVMSE